MSQNLDFWRTGVARPLDRFFEEFMSPNFKRKDGLETSHGGFHPQCEVSESKEGYHMKFDLPGISKDQIKIELHENQLTVSGERKEERNVEDKKTHFSEVYYGSFTRSFTFPTQVDAEKVLAEYDNGVLNINIPKSEQSRSRQITIK